MPAVGFDWDPEKDLENQTKHGVAFEKAQYAFADPLRVIAEDLSHSAREKRYYCFGGASAIQCCYAAIERREWFTSTNKVESKNTKVTLRSAKKCMVEEKISRNVSRLVVSPACMAGVRTSSPNISAR